MKNHTHYSRLIISISLVAIFLVLSCKSENKPQETSEETTENIEKEPSSSSIIPLPDMDLDVDQFGEYEIKNDSPLADADIQKLNIEKIDHTANQADYPGLQYYLLKEIYNGKEGKSLLISRNSEMENYAWLANYDTQNKLLDFKIVFYDEWAESAVRITSVIKNNKITIAHYILDFETGKENKNVAVFYINETLKFKADNY